MMAMKGKSSVATPTAGEPAELAGQTVAQECWGLLTLQRGELRLVFGGDEAAIFRTRGAAMAEADRLHANGEKGRHFVCRLDATLAIRDGKEVGLTAPAGGKAAAGKS